ncbi:MAG: hypothetical protein WEB63_00840 [Cucumibacter sp.]
MPDLPAAFRHIRLELAREKGQPEGDRGHGYDILAPLKDDGRIDAKTWKAHAARCRVRRFRPREADRIGVLRRRSDGNWFFDYDNASSADDEAGFRFADEKFTPGEYVSLREDDGDMHTFRVTSVERP